MENRFENFPRLGQVKYGYPKCWENFCGKRKFRIGKPEKKGKKIAAAPDAAYLRKISHRNPRQSTGGKAGIKHQTPIRPTRMGVTSGESWYLTSFVYLSFFQFAASLNLSPSCLISVLSYLPHCVLSRLCRTYGWDCCRLAYVTWLLLQLGIEFVVHGTHSFL